MISTVKPALVLMMGRGFAFLATLLLPLALVRIFDQAAFGTYRQIFVVYGTLYGIGQLGMAESLFYFLPHAPRQGGRYVANSMLSLGAAGLAGLGALWAGAPTLARWLGNPDLAHQLPLLGVFLVLMLPAAVLETAMVARHRYAWSSWSYGLSDVARALAMLLPGLVWRRLDWLLIGAAGFAAARLIVAVLFLRREFPGELRPQATLFREQLAYALPFAAAALVETLQGSYHYYAVSHRFAAATFAVYSVGCLQFPLTELLTSALANVMMVRMAERIREGRIEEATMLWMGTIRALALVSLPILAFLLLAAPEIIVAFYTGAYRASVPIFMIWSLSIALSVLPTDGALRVYAATRFLLAVSALKLLLIAALIGAFIALLGLPGAVLVTTVAAIVGKGLSLARLSRLMGVGLRRLAPWRDLAGIGILAAAAAVPALAVKAALDLPPIGGLAVAGPLYGSTYLFLLFSSGLLSEDERQAIQGRIQRWTLGAAARLGASRS
jgi:O-antigen/teichoic acid export membrane protein